MKEIIKKVSLGISAMALLAFTAVGVIGAPAHAATTTEKPICQGIDKVLGGSNCQGTDSAGIFDVAATIVNWILIAVGIICVVFIIFGGIRYATSGGDAEKVKSAKNTLLYAIIGLAIALLAGVIVGIVTSIAGEAISPAS